VAERPGRLSISAYICPSDPVCARAEASLEAQAHDETIAIRPRASLNVLRDGGDENPSRGKAGTYRQAE